MPLFSRKIVKNHPKKTGTATSVKKSMQKDEYSPKVYETRSEGFLPKFNQAELRMKKRLKRREKARRNAQDELVTLFGSKKEGSEEFNKKLSSYVKKFGQLEIADENADLRENLKNLLINKQNEIDVERIMALHLLSIRPTRKCYRLQFLEESEEEGDASKQLTRYSEILPHYILVSDDLNHCDCFRDKNRKYTKSTTMHLSINRQVEQLINTTLDVIRKSNPSKLEKIWLQAYDTSVIKKLLTRQKFRYLMTSMKYNLQWLFVNKSDEDVITQECEVRDMSFFGVNKTRDYQDNTVFKIILPGLIHKEILFDDRTKYLLKVAETGLRLIKGHKYLIPEDGLCIYQYPEEPAGIIILSEDGQFISLINGPEFHHKNSDKFTNIAIYVLFHSGIKNHRKEFEEYIQDKYKKKHMDKDRINGDCNDEKKIETTKQNLMKKMLKFLQKEERRIFTYKYSLAKRLTKENNENVDVKFAQILKEVISINRILRYLSEFPIEEREIAMKSSNYGGLGIARAIIGRKTMQVIKDLCGREVNQLQVTPIHNTNLLDTELRKVKLNIPENIDIIYKELYNFEHSTANRLFLRDLSPNKVKQFDI